MLSPEMIEKHLAKSKIGQDEISIMHALNLDSSDTIELNAVLDYAINNGLIYEKKGLFYSCKKKNIILGEIQIAADGYGFVKDISSNLKEDVFVPRVDLNGALNGDLVYCKYRINSKLLKNYKGFVKRVYKKSNQTIVGTVIKSKKGKFKLIPDQKNLNQTITLSKSESKNLKENDKLVLEVKNWGRNLENTDFRVKENIGQIGESRVDLISVIRRHKLPDGFSSKVYKEAERIPQTVSEDEIKNRKDFRSQNSITIDSIDAKDLDDAVYLEKLENGNFKLFVHIADVAHYVNKKTKIDKEAKKRACSVYLLDKVIPMLPETLSNGICSLNMGVDRLCVSLEMDINKEGKVLEFQIYESVINVKRRCTYKEVSEIIESNIIDKNSNIDVKIQEYLLEMFKLANILSEKRKKRGSINFEFPETQIILDENFKAKDIISKKREISEKIIEELMIISNEIVAKNAFDNKVPFIYRVHESPSLEKVDDLNILLSPLGLKIISKNNKVTSHQVNELLKKIKGLKEERLLSKMTLRTMKQARYSCETLGHFGLSSMYYSHFTAPIRRYPDLAIHRVIKENIIKKNPFKKSQLNIRLREVSDHSSIRERVAEKAEYDLIDIKKAEYMSDKITQKFTGIISYIGRNVLFVELENTVEGKVEIDDLMKGLSFDLKYDEYSRNLRNKENKIIFSIGDKVDVQLIRVDVNIGEIEFRLLGKTKN